MAKFNERKIYGAWSDGYVLDLHSTGSTYTSVITNSVIHSSKLIAPRSGSCFSV